MPELGTVIASYLGDAEAASRTRGDVRELRRDLTHVATALGTMEVGAVRPRDVQDLVDELRGEGVAQDRVQSVLEALRGLYAYAIGQGLVRTSPLVGLAATDGEAPTPTNAMLALGEGIVAWTMRVIVIAFVLIALGLVVALA